MVESQHDLLDRQLKELIDIALKVKDADPLTYHRTIHRLIMCIQRSGQLGRPQSNRWKASQYEDMYAEALQMTLCYISQNLKQYNPKFAVMAWVNQILKFRFTDVVRKVYRERKKILSLQELRNEAFTEPDEETDEDRLRHHITTDPVYKEAHIKGRPDANFATIFIMKLDSMTYKQMGAHFELKQSTISTFFDRQLKKSVPRIRQYLM